MADDVDATARRLALVLTKLRAEGTFSVGTFLDAVEAGLGGTLVLRAPSSRHKREIPEARYVSEGVAITGRLEFEGE